jgi:hypothetical protein
MNQKTTLSLLLGFLFCFASSAQIANPNEPSIQSALTSAWKQVQAIKHPLLTKASKVKPSFVHAGHGLVSVELDYTENADWNPKGRGPISGDPVPIDPERPYLFIQVSLGRASAVSQPHVQGRSFRAGDIDYSLLVTVASSDQEVSKRVESILTHAFDPWQVYPNFLTAPPGGANLPASNPPTGGGIIEEKDPWPYSAAYRGLTPLSKGDAKRRAIRECEFYAKTTANVVISIMPVEATPDYFRVLVRGKLGRQTVINSVAIHRFNPKGDKIERDNDPAQEPTVSTLTALLGHSIEDKIVTDFITERGLQKYYKFDSGAFRKPEGASSFALGFERNKIVCIIIYLSRLPEISTPYLGALPCGVRASDAPRNVRKRMGPAKNDTVQRKGGGGLKYERDGIAFTVAFDGNKMEEIYLELPP